MRNYWNRELGTRQGRMKPSSPIAGAYVFCLGQEASGTTGDVSPGDFALIEQHATFTSGTKLLRIRAVIRPPAAVPAGHRWVLEILLDDVVKIVHPLITGGPTRERFFSLNVSKAAVGKHFVTMQLRFVPNSIHQVISMASFECGPAEDLTLPLASMASQESFGVPYIGHGVPLFPAGIDSGESVAEPTVFPPSQSLGVSGIASDGAFGTASAQRVITASSISSGEAFGTPNTLSVEAVLGADLRRFWKFDYTAATGVWVDSVGDADTTQGTSDRRPTLGATPGGNAAVSFDGSNDFVTASGSAFSGTPTRALIFGLLKNNSPSTINRRFALFVHTSSAAGIGIGMDNGSPPKLTANMQGSGTGQSAATADDGLDDGWHTWAVKLDGDKVVTLYIDGVAQADTGAHGANAVTNFMLALASNSGNSAFGSANVGTPDNVWNGMLAAVGVAVNDTTDFSAQKIADLHTALAAIRG